MYTSLDLFVVFLLYQDAGYDLTEASNRETELKNVCMEQAAKIEQLNQLVIILLSPLNTVIPQLRFYLINNLNFCRESRTNTSYNIRLWDMIKKAILRA